MKKSLGAKTIVYPTPVFVVGTYDEKGRANAMAVAWGGICCSKPPCVAISVREATYTYGNLMKERVFTVSIPSEKHIKEADYFGLVSGKEEDKFQKTSLTPVRSDVVPAPYVAEFPFILECKVIKDIPIGIHTQFIGEILDIKADEEILNSEGIPDISKIKPCFFDPSQRNYYGAGRFLGKAFSVGREIS